MPNTFHFPLMLMCVLLLGLLTSCGDRDKATEIEPIAQVDLEAFKILRRYGWDAVVSDPQPVWNPKTHQVAVRIPTGLGLLDEGRNRQQYFTAENGGEYGDPQWYTTKNLITGPIERPQLAHSGQLLLPVQPLRALKAEGDSLSLMEELSIPGYRPRAWGEKVLVQRGEELHLVGFEGTQVGSTELFGLGFDAEPQTNGPGVAYNTLPVFYEDLWTGQTGLGDLVVRWEEGQTDIYPALVQPSWTAKGGLVATLLKEKPVPGEPWGRSGVSVVHIPGPGQRPILLMAGAHSPAPHPTLDVLTLVTTGGEVQMVSMDGLQVKTVATAGRSPQWHPGGRRLLYLRPQVQEPFIQVLVYHFGEADEAQE